MTDRPLHVFARPAFVRRAARTVALVAASAALTATAIVAPGPGPTPSARAVSGTEAEVVALVVEGVGNGHGRGMSQWGAYGRALAGQTWEQILAAYYGNTSRGQATGRITVRLVGLDDHPTTGVVAHAGSVRWGGHAYASMHAAWVSGNTYRVFGTSAHACPGASALVVPDGPVVRGANDGGNSSGPVHQIQRFLDTFGFAPGPIDGIFGGQTEAAVLEFQGSAGLLRTGRWQLAEATEARARIASSGSASWVDLGTTSGPVRFTTSVNESTAAPRDVLGVCQRNGSLIHYRGDVLAIRDGNGARRTVNDVAIDAYVRGVVPREMSASWGAGGGGRGMHALRAQAVAARSYALAQNRYTFARTCDTTACQAYGGAARRSTASSGVVTNLEFDSTDRAVADTAGVVLRRNGSIVSSEYSASNGPRTAGGFFAAIDDPWDDHPSNPNHRWTRVIPASSVAARYGTGVLTAAQTEADPALVNAGFQGIWSHRVRVSGSSKTITVPAWDFRGHFGLPSPGFTVRAVTRDLVSSQSIALVGDSISTGVVGAASRPLEAMLAGVYRSPRYDALSGRTTTGALSAIGSIPFGTDLVVVQLGYNDPADYAGKIDQVMAALRTRGVGRVVWVNLSERAGRGFDGVNAALRAAPARWNELAVLDWNAASAGAARDRWFASDRVHLTTTGNAEFARFVRDQLVTSTGGGARVTPAAVLRVPVAGVAGAPPGASGVVLNVTGTEALQDGFVTVWPCGSPRPWASSVNVTPGDIVPNEVIARVDGTGEVCMYASQATHLVVDVVGWFTGGFVPRERPERLVDTREGQPRVSPERVLRVPVAGVADAPAGASGVVLNVTGTEALQDGFVTVWPCGSPRPWASSLNVTPGRIVANEVIARVDGTGEVCMYASQATHLVVDVAGWFTGGFVPRERPERLEDTRER